MFSVVFAIVSIKLPSFVEGMHMNEQDILEILRIEGRYEVTTTGGRFYVRPITFEEIIISISSHEECKEHFSKTGN